MKKQFGVIGLGRFGTAVAKDLEKLGYPVLAIDTDPKLVDSVKDYVSFADIVDAKNPEALAAAGIRNCDTVIVAVGDIESSILISLILEEFGIKNIIAKAVSDVHEKVLRKIGVKEVVFPEADMGIRVVNRLTSTNILDYISISPDVDLLEYKASKKLSNKSLKELALRNRFGINIIAIKRDDDVIVSPSADELILEGDELFFIGKTQDILEFKKEFEK
ncbi:MAG: TrkA family potassium uptake protein [Caldiserica bacterium]|jgi:trk system potassium uptake protein TrkA|nr:TrkA family potassium uptake protein [Caldisericota bacterium]